jgi:hypothetical protein
LPSKATSGGTAPKCCCDSCKWSGWLPTG